MNAMGVAGLPPWPRRADEPDDDLREHLVTACVLVLLHETPATSAQLEGALAALRLRDWPGGLQRVLETMEEDGYVFSTWGPPPAGRQRHTFHIAPLGTQWLCEAAGELQQHEGFLGAFVARCGERLL